MMGLLRKLFLLLFVEKRCREKAEAAMSRRRGNKAGGAPVSREQLIRQALKMCQKKEHLWDDMSEEERAKVLEQLGNGMAAQIEQMKGASD